MPAWITHFMIADSLMAEFPTLDRRGFCVGNIAPDCNVENESWTEFTPSRETTHWMSGKRKILSDSDAFCRARIMQREHQARAGEEYAFLLGYYAHLITDAAFQSFTRDERRVQSVWRRIRDSADWCRAAQGRPETWDAVKQLIPSSVRTREYDAIEADYLSAHPHSGYLTDILPLREFPDYLDYMPHGCIVRKIGIMGYLPSPADRPDAFICVTPEELFSFAEKTATLIADRFREHVLLP